MAKNFTEFNLPRNAYTAFDAVSMKQLMINRLKESGLFTDVDFEGSNISGLVDVIAYTYHVLLFYLNQTASESLFSQSDLVENMNKIVSLLNYNVRGANTAQLKVEVTAGNNLVPNSYTIKRFGYTLFQNIRYTFAKDITFEKIETGSEVINSIGNENLMFQGTIKEYPIYVAIGEDFEEVVINIDYPEEEANQNKFIDTNNIFVFVKPTNLNKWVEAKEVPNIFLSKDISYYYEKKVNEYGHHQLKFGNNINAKALEVGDLVAIYYLESDGNLGIIGSNLRSDVSLIPFKTSQFDEIMADISDSNYMSPDDSASLTFRNVYASIPPVDGESSQEMKQNVPAIFALQNRLVTASDYTTFVKRNFSNIVHDTAILSNDEYTNNYIKYFYTVGLDRPNADPIYLLNQIKFRNACDFNNVYIFCVPNMPSELDSPISLFDSQKQFIYDSLLESKVINQNIVFEDPIYVAFGIGVVPLGESPSVELSENSKLIVYRKQNTLSSKDSVKEKVLLAFEDFFDIKNNKLGQFIDLGDLSLKILSIDGIDRIEIESEINGVVGKTNKLSFIYWNPFYSTIDVNQTIQNIKLENFQFPYLYNKTDLINKITVI